MSRRAVLWIAFAVVHVAVAAAGWVMPNEPMGDVYRVYEPWSAQALAGQGIVGIDSEWVYPQLALIPMVLAQAFTPLFGYVIGWVIVVTLADAAAFAVLTGKARSVGRVQAAWFWLAFIALLGPVGLYRLDGLTVPLAIVGCLWLVSRPWAASMILTAVTWIKVWPAALLAAAVIALRRRSAMIGGAAILSGLTILAVVAAGGATHLLGFVGEQTTRGLQVEAPVATPYLWGAVIGAEGFEVFYSFDILTFQVTGTGIDLVIAVMTPLLVVAMASVAVIGAVKAVRGVRFVSLFPPLSLALVLGFIVFNKVGSPQYLVWMVPSLVTGLVLARKRWMLPAAAALGAALLTQLVYPLMYQGILQPEPVTATVLTLRNLALIALFVWMVARLVRLPVPVRTIPVRHASVPPHSPALPA